MFDKEFIERYERALERPVGPSAALTGMKLKLAAGMSSQDLAVEAEKLADDPERFAAFVKSKPDPVILSALAGSRAMDGLSGAATGPDLSEKPRTIFECVASKAAAEHIELAGKNPAAAEAREKSWQPARDMIAQGHLAPEMARVESTYGAAVSQKMAETRGKVPEVVPAEGYAPKGVMRDVPVPEPRNDVAPAIAQPKLFQTTFPGTHRSIVLPMDMDTATRLAKSGHLDRSRSEAGESLAGEYVRAAAGRAPETLRAAGGAAVSKLGDAARRVGEGVRAGGARVAAVPGAVKAAGGRLVTSACSRAASLMTAAASRSPFAVTRFNRSLKKAMERGPAATAALLEKVAASPAKTAVAKRAGLESVVVASCLGASAVGDALAGRAIQPGSARPLARLAADLQERETAGDLVQGSLTPGQLSPAAKRAHYPKGTLPADADYVHSRNRLAASALGFSEGSAKVVDVERAWNDRGQVNRQWGELSKGGADPDVDLDRDLQARVRDLGRAGAKERTERTRADWWRTESQAPPDSSQRDQSAREEPAPGKPAPAAVVPGPEVASPVPSTPVSARRTDPVRPASSPEGVLEFPVASRPPVDPRSNAVEPPKVEIIGATTMSFPTQKMMEFPKGELPPRSVSSDVAAHFTQDAPSSDGSRAWNVDDPEISRVSIDRNGNAKAMFQRGAVPSEAAAAWAVSAATAVDRGRIVPNAPPRAEEVPARPPSSPTVDLGTHATSVPKAAAVRIEPGDLPQVDDSHVGADDAAIFKAHPPAPDGSRTWDINDPDGELANVKFERDGGATVTYRPGVEPNEDSTSWAMTVPLCVEKGYVKEEDVRGIPVPAKPAVPEQPVRPSASERVETAPAGSPAPRAVPASAASAERSGVPAPADTPSKASAPAPVETKTAAASAGNLSKASAPAPVEAKIPVTPAAPATSAKPLVPDTKTAGAPVGEPSKPAAAAAAYREAKRDAAAEPSKPAAAAAAYRQYRQAKSDAAGTEPATSPPAPVPVEAKIPATPAAMATPGKPSARPPVETKTAATPAAPGVDSAGSGQKRTPAVSSPASVSETSTSRDAHAARLGRACVLSSMYSGKTCDKLVDQSVRAIESSVPDPQARAAIYRDASERARALAPKVPGLDGARAQVAPSETIHPKITKAVQRAQTQDRPSVPTIEVKGAPIKLLPPGQGVGSKSSEGSAPERPSAVERLMPPSKDRAPAVEKRAAESHGGSDR